MPHAQDSTRTDIFILYQDSDRNIRQAWTQGAEPFQHSSPEALKNVDEGTDIACITMNTAAEKPSLDSLTYPVYMRLDVPLRRCFFQRGGAIVEVEMRGTDWEVIGEVPQ
jgi:hypothetical protein